MPVSRKIDKHSGKDLRVFFLFLQQKIQHDSGLIYIFFDMKALYANRVLRELCFPCIIINMENNSTKDSKKNMDDTEDFSETRVLERMTDASYDQETAEHSTATNEDDAAFSQTEDPAEIKEPKTEKANQTKKNANKDKDEPAPTAAGEVLSFIRDLAICVVAVFLLTSFVIRPVQVKGSSMYPELNDASIGFSNVIGYNISGLKRFDIAIIYVAEKDEYLVKRVIGLPGETVSYEDGQLYINGAFVKEDFFNQDYVDSYNGTFMSDVAPITLGDDEYYCLGDNRPHSSDSRYYGPFKKANIKSKGVFIFWPFDKFSVQTW
jgi:signal peptidase I